MIFKLNKLNTPLFSVIVFLCAGSWLMPVDSSNILAIQLIAGKSHWNFMSGILRALVDKGHNVTAFTMFPDGNRENYTEVNTSQNVTKIQDLKLEDLMEVFSNIVKNFGLLMDLGRETCENIYEKYEMKKLLNNRNFDFDVVLIEPILPKCMSYAADKLKLPSIYVVSLPIIGEKERYYTGHIPNPALISNLFASSSTPKTFVDRLTNTAIYIYSVIVYEYKEFIYQYTETKDYDFIIPKPPSLIFVNSHFISNAVYPTSTEIIHIGGIHLKPPKALPKDILEFIEQSPHGVIYFSFGSTVNMSTLPKHIQNSFLEALGQVSQRVLLKYETDLENKPKNVMIKKWLPQRDILLHPNVKLFISHGGISGLYEAVDSGIPVLGFPLFADQPRNVDNLVKAGMAISMDLLFVDKDIFLKNVKELINNEKYKNNAKIASEIFKDRPISSTESAVYWTEYVIRHKGAPHLKSQALNLTWYQYYLLDVIACLLIIICIVLFTIFKCTNYIYTFVTKYSNQVKAKFE